jgi:bis(5'-nucleosyl)-tetraphosphatase (symmetrical)
MSVRRRLRTYSTGVSGRDLVDAGLSSARSGDERARGAGLCAGGEQLVACHELANMLAMLLHSRSRLRIIALAIQVNSMGGVTGLVSYDDPLTDDVHRPELETVADLLQDSQRATYAVGDVQGCFDDLLRLLDAIDFDPDVDRLWFTGDLVNRGPNSLALLRFVKALGDAAITVLGNHDLHLLAAAAGAVNIGKKDTITEILNAPDCEELLFWLRHQPLLHHDQQLGYTMVHAGLPPQWGLEKAKACAAELERVLQNFHYEDLFRHMKAEKPYRWRDDLEGWGRLRFIANCFTQLRCCDRSGRLDLACERRKAPGKKRSMPWFKIPDRASRDLSILFGHWAALDSTELRNSRVHHLDTGCANGGRFTALRLQDLRYFRIRCKNRPVPWPSEPKSVCQSPVPGS